MCNLLRYLGCYTIWFEVILRIWEGFLKNLAIGPTTPIVSVAAMLAVGQVNKVLPNMQMNCHSAKITLCFGTFLFQITLFKVKFTFLFMAG